MPGGMGSLDCLMSAHPATKHLAGHHRYDGHGNARNGGHELMSAMSHRGASCYALPRPIARRCGEGCRAYVVAKVFLEIEGGRKRPTNMKFVAL